MAVGYEGDIPHVVTDRSFSLHAASFAPDDRCHAVGLSSRPDVIKRVEARYGALSGCSKDSVVNLVVAPSRLTRDFPFVGAADFLNDARAAACS